MNQAAFSRVKVECLRPQMIPESYPHIESRSGWMEQELILFSN